MRTKYFSFVFILILGFIFLSSLTNVNADGKYSVKGTFVEGCSCDIPCPCELISFKTGCQTIGALSLSGGSCCDIDLTGVKIAYATQPGEWVTLYVDAKDDKQKQAAIKFAKGLFGHYGKIEKAGSATIEFSGKDGNYTVKVDDGKIMQLTTEPVLGGDNKTPVMYTNTKSKLTPVFMQGRVLSGSFNDGERSFELKGSNSYFNTNIHCEGSSEP
ncbi:MAG: DUF1326 domain-containing protein [Candidatus Loosdrechtia sp.]|uniref:DUF1326 domain-containing protein n=1 Tax=Candidatus Loosdrechtia sp. TaxID=3101272 RepID=UPI003A7236B9|nr:MAG: DUF1326 domain-containing protein [Candidatus Jettenia sp. AMX2]